jgi:hypothetical protein
LVRQCLGNPSQVTIQSAIHQAYRKGRVRSMRDVGGILNGAIQGAIGDLL